MRILLTEDDEVLGDGLKAGLTMEGYAVDWIKDGRLADEALITNQYEAIVLDLNLPGIDGLEVLKRLRRRKDETPVLILTARDTVTERVYGLDCGADDFVVKPFDLKEICARIRALVRRHHGRSHSIHEHQGIMLNPSSHQVTFDNKPIVLSQKEFEILNFLLDNKGKVISRFRLEETLYAWNFEIESNAVEVHIHHLRKKLNNSVIRTIRGVGYIIDEC